MRQALRTQEAERERLAEATGELDRRTRAAQETAEGFQEQVDRLDATHQAPARERDRLIEELADLARTLAGLEAEQKGLVARQESVEERRADLAESPGAAFARPSGVPRHPE